MAHHPGFVMELFKILHSSLEHADIIFTGNVPVQILADTLAVTHLAEDTTVGRGDALDGEQGTALIYVS